MSGAIAGLIGSLKKISAPAFSSLFPNGNFATSSLTGWTFDNTASTVSTIQSFSAPQSLFVASQPNNDPTTAGAHYSGNILTVGKTYSLSVRWYGNQYSQLTLTMYAGTASGGQYSSPVGVTGGGWNYFLYPVNLTATGTGILKVDIDGGGVNGFDWYLDDIILTQQ